MVRGNRYLYKKLIFSGGGLIYQRQPAIGPNFRRRAAKRESGDIQDLYLVYIRTPTSSSSSRRIDPHLRPIEHPQKARERGLCSEKERERASCSRPIPLEPAAGDESPGGWRSLAGGDNPRERFAERDRERLKRGHSLRSCQSSVGHGHAHSSHLVSGSYPRRSFLRFFELSLSCCRRRCTVRRQLSTGTYYGSAARPDRSLLTRKVHPVQSHTLRRHFLRTSRSVRDRLLWNDGHGT